MEHREITLYTGEVALVSAEDYEALSQFRWHRRVAPNGTKYALRTVVTERGPRKVGMHREILNAPKGMEVDHVNGDGLDNRRRNLRLCTPRQNMLNRCSLRGSRSRYKGVCPHQGRFMVFINPEVGNQVYIGSYTTEEEAAHAYDAAAREHHGRFGRYNFPREGERSALPGVSAPSPRESAAAGEGQS